MLIKVFHSFRENGIGGWNPSTFPRFGGEVFCSTLFLFTSIHTTYLFHLTVVPRNRPAEAVQRLRCFGGFSYRQESFSWYVLLAWTFTRSGDDGALSPW